MSQVELKTHYSAAELAEMKLPGVPASVSGIFRAAQSGHWEVKKRQGRGGGYEYALSSLPETAVRAIKDRLVKSMVAAPVVSVPALPMKAAQMELALTSRQQTVEGARKGVLVAIERLMAGCGVTREAAIHTLLTQAKAGTLDPHLERMLCAAHDGRGRKGDNPYPSVRSIKGWRALEKQGQLAPKTAVSTVLEIPAWAKSFLTYWQLPSKPSVAHAYEQFLRDWTDKTEDVPSVHQVRRFIGKLGAVSREVGRMGPREMKNIKPFIRRDISQLQPNDVWTADGHTFDAEVQHPMHGRPFRPEITAIIDVATRRIIGWSVGLAESGLAVLDAITHAVTREGVMAIFYVDNGSGYKNDMLRNESTGIMGRLGVDMRFARPYNSQGKGAIERPWKSVFVRAAKELPSYIGADMDREAKLNQFKITRKAIKAGGSVGLISWPQFIEFINQHIADYNARPHSGLNGISPDMKLAEFVSLGWEPTRLQPGEEAYLFRPQVERTISRCEISVFGNRYFSRELEEFHGERLRIGYDVNSANQVWVYADDGRLICTAEWNANVRSYFPVSVVEQARDRRAAGRADRLQVHLEEVQAERRGKPAIEAQQEIVIPGLISGTREQLAEAAALARAKRQPQTVEAPALRVIDVEPIPAPSNVLSLPDNGVENLFNALILETRAGKRDYSIHRITLDDAIADGLYQRICYVTNKEWSAEAEAKWRADLYKNAPNPESADEEYGCVPKNSGGNWLSSMLIEKRMSADTPVLRYECPTGFELEPDHVRASHCQDWIDSVLQPELDKLPKGVRSFDGEDFARSGDLSVHVPLIEMQNLVKRVPFILEMRNVPFRQQEQITFHLLDNLPGFAGGAFDARGNGQYLAEVAMQRYGADRIHQVMLSESWYREHMPPVKAALEDGDLDGLPKDKDVLADMRAVQIIKGVPRIPETRTTGEDKGKRHGDVAVGVALAVYASRVIDAAPLATRGYKSIPRGSMAMSSRFGRGTW